jgi:hypothetical protein
MTRGRTDGSDRRAANDTKLRKRFARQPPCWEPIIQSESWYALGIQSCTVSFDDGTGIRHSVQVSAESMFEAAALALHIFENDGTPPGPAAHLEMVAQVPVVNHSVSVQRVRDWLNSGGKSPKEQALKSRLRELT